jgi:hypothetical protein
LAVPATRRLPHESVPRGATDVKIAQLRANVFSVTATGQELSALIAAGRLAVDVMRGDPAAPREALALLERVLRDYDEALARLRKEDGRPRRPS